MDLKALTSSNRLIYVLVGAVSLLVLLTFVLILRGLGTKSTENVRLEFWGVFDDRAAFGPAIEKFQKLHPNISIVYKQLSYDEYERSIVDALAAGTGPDVLLIHNTWLAKHGDKLRPMPAKIKGLSDPLMTIKQYREMFVDVAARDFIKDDHIYAMPVYVDTLALYYNKDLFNSAAISRPPATWNEFNDDVERLTKFDASRNIVQSGAAIGTSRNVNRSTDILAALMIQSGTQMTNTDNDEATFAHSVGNQPVGETALRYYTDFSRPTKEVYCWNANQHYSIDAFSEGTAAMMFNYSHQIDALRRKSLRLNFSVAPMPQLSDTDQRTYASYWAPAVTVGSAHPDEAWQFVAYLASQEGAVSYLNQTHRPAARRDIIDQQKSDPDLNVFAVQALTARSWYQADDSAIESIFADMIDDVNLGRASALDAIRNAESRVTVLMNKKR